MKEPLTTDPLADHAADLEYLRRANGLYAGQLNDGEMAAFNRLVKAGLAQRVYEGAAGFMGLAKVRIYG